MEEHENQVVTPIGQTDFRNQEAVFGIKKLDRRGHVYILGKTGMGKSTLLESMIRSDLYQGNGIGVIDPHGDLIERILTFIPKNRAQNTIYFNPADYNNPIAFNILEKTDARTSYLIASGIVSAFKKNWSEFFGPRMEYILRNALLSLLEIPGTTLLDLSKILVDQQYRSSIVPRLKDAQLKEFWINEFDKITQYLRMQAISPILNKVGQFLTNPIVRNIVGQKETAFDVRKVMDKGKIILINLSKGKIGEDNSALLGAMLVSKLELAALSRADIAEDKRRDFYLYCDEFPNYTTESFKDLLAQSRKYHLCLTLVNQYTDQLDDQLKSAVFGNVGTVLTFRVGAKDAEYLAQEFYPVFQQSHFLNLPKYHFYLRLQIDGVSSDPFSAISLPPVTVIQADKLRIIRSSREKYSHSRSEVENEARIRSHRPCIKSNAKIAGQGRLNL